MATTQPTLSQFEAWITENRHLALNVIAARAIATTERKRVDSYILPIFRQFDFPVSKPEDLYLCNDDAKVERFYAACDAAHREHGFTGPEGHCPALTAEALVIDAETDLLTAGAALFGMGGPPYNMDDRKRMLELLLGACLKDQVA